MATCKTRLLQEDIESILKEKRTFVDELFDNFDRLSDKSQKARADVIVNSIDYEVKNITDISCVFSGLISRKDYFYIEKELENIKINFMLRFNAKIKEEYFKNFDV